MLGRIRRLGYVSVKGVLNVHDGLLLSRLHASSSKYRAIAQARYLLEEGTMTECRRNIVALKILMVSSEAFPLAKTGGLGDAVSGLSQSLPAQGAQVTLMLPAYRGTLEAIRYVRQLAVLTDIPGGDAVLLAGECPQLGVPVLLVKNDALYDRDGLYVSEDGDEHEDNAVRFAALAHAAAWVARGVEGIPRPHVVHCHDWHAALVPLLLRQYQVDE